MADLLAVLPFAELPSTSEIARIQIVGPGGTACVVTGTAASLVAGPSAGQQALNQPSSVSFAMSASSYNTLGQFGRFQLNALGTQINLVAFVGTQNFYLRKLSTDVVVFASDAGGTLTASSFSLDLGWHDIEVWFTHSDTVGGYRIIIDGTEILNVASVDTHVSGSTTLTGVVWNGNFRFCDAVVFGKVGAVTSGEIASQPGATVRVASLHMNGVGNYTAWTNLTNTGANHYNELDEAIADGDTSRLQANAINGRDSYLKEQLDAVVLGVQKVLGLSTWVAQWNFANAIRFVPFLRYNGSNVDATQYTGGSGAVKWTNSCHIWQSEIASSNAWTTFDGPDAVDILNDYEVGVMQTVDSLFLTVVSQAVLHVVYLSAPAPADPSTSDSIVRRRKNHRLTKTFLVRRTDGVEITTTEHDKDLVVDGTTYSPTGGILSSAVRTELLLKDVNSEYVGAIRSDKISIDDLRAGRYDDALIIERIIDWRYPPPLLGDVRRHVYWVTKVDWDDYSWTAEVSGLAQRLQRRRGFIIGPVCDNDLGDAICKVNMGSFTFTGIAVTGVTSRRVFAASSIGSFADGYFAFGEVVWTTGPNLGISFKIRAYEGAGRLITTYLPMPFAITNGDQFTIRAGCDGLFSTCKAKFSNPDNFKGTPYTPGRDSAMRGTTT